jgi:hypothetical protein
MTPATFWFVAQYLNHCATVVLGAEWCALGNTRMQLPILFTKLSLRLCITFPTSYRPCIAGTRCFPGVRRPGCGVDHFTFINSSNNEAIFVTSRDVTGWTFPYFYQLTLISGYSRYSCCWFWFLVGHICCWPRYSVVTHVCCWLWFLLVADVYVVALISSYSRHTYTYMCMMLVSIRSYCRHISVVGSGIRLFQTYCWLWNSVVADTYMPVVGFEI